MAFSFGTTPSTGFGAPSTGSSLFGPSATTPTTGSSLFAPGSSTTPSLFGASTPATSATPSLFGSAPTTSTTPSLFGASPSPFGVATTTASTTPSLFGPSTSTSSTLFGPSTTGIGLGGNTTGAPNVGWDTMYAALPDMYKKEMESIQKKISEEKDIIEYMTSRKSEPALRVKEEAEMLTEKLHTLLHTLENDILVVNNFKKEVLNELRNAESAARSIERFKSPMLMSQYQTYPPNSNYFHQLVFTFEKRMQQYRQLIEELEKYLSVGDQHTYTPKMLQDIMRNQHQFFVTLAAQIATLHDSIEEIRHSYLAFRVKYYNDNFDPFEDADRRQKKKEMLDLSKKLRPNENQTTLALPAPSSTPSTISTTFPATTTNPTTSTSLFGPPSTSTPTTTSLFGTTPSTAAPTATGSSLFGTTTTTTPSTTTLSSTGGLFGATSTPATTTTLTASTGGFGFGVPTTAPSATSFSNVTSTPSSGSLFVADSTKRPSSSKGGGRKR